VFSYHANRSARPDAARRSTKKLADGLANASATMLRGTHVNWLKRGPMLAGLAFVLLLALANLLLSSSPKVMVASDTSGQIFLRPPATYVQGAHDAFAASFFNRNKITVNTGAIASRMHSQFPELASVSVSLPFFGMRPVVYIRPATPKILLASANNGTYVVDENGRALIASQQATHLDKLHLPVVTDQSGLAVGLGKAVLPSGSVSFITEVVGQLQTKHITINTLTLPKASNELDVQVSGTPYSIKFNLQGNGRAEAGTYLAVAAQLQREHKTPASYIDVRVDQRAYYW